MLKSLLIWAFALVASRSVSAQQTGGTYTDPLTGFTFQRYVNGNYTFGIAVPEVVTTDFIAQFSVNSTVGWAGASMGGTMLNSLLLVAFPDGEGGIRASIRQADDYANPHLINSTAASLAPIAQGTTVDATAGSFTLTFLCQSCILTDGRTFYANATAPVLGWTQSVTPLADTSAPDAPLNFHANYGSWTVDLPAAASADFDAWAATASAGNGTTLSVTAAMMKAAAANATTVAEGYARSERRSRALRRGTGASRPVPPTY